MKKLALLVILMDLAGCWQGHYHLVTFQVTGSEGLETVSVFIGDSDMTIFAGLVLLPFNYSFDLRNIDTSLIATNAGTSGTVTATILVDGSVVQTASATAAGSPASVIVTAFIPK